MTQDGSASITLTVWAHDHGIPSLSSSTTVVIYVDDVNDNSPLFERDEYEITISESTPKGTTVFTVIATDRDTTENGLLQYSLENADTGEYGNDGQDQDQ